MAPKKHGKGTMISDTPPVERPEDLPDGCPYNFNLREPKNNKNLLFETMRQGYQGHCWTIVYTRVIAAHLYNQGRTEELLSLSTKHLYGHIKEIFSSGHLKNNKGIKKILVEEGLVSEKDCKCKAGKTGVDTKACDKVKDKTAYKIREFVVVENNIDETDIIRLLTTRGPVAAHIRMTYEYGFTKKDEIYYGPKKPSKTDEEHIVLISEIGTKDGVHYFEFQNTAGLDWGGDGGFGKFARKISLAKVSPSLIVAYMYPELEVQG